MKVLQRIEVDGVLIDPDALHDRIFAGGAKQQKRGLVHEREPIVRPRRIVGRISPKICAPGQSDQRFTSNCWTRCVFSHRGSPSDHLMRQGRVPAKTGVQWPGVPLGLRALRGGRSWTSSRRHTGQLIHARSDYPGMPLSPLCPCQAGSPTYRPDRRSRGRCTSCRSARATVRSPQEKEEEGQLRGKTAWGRTAEAG